MIHIVDYGLGNIQAFIHTYKRLDLDVMVARNETDLAGATKIILPGVGSFDHAMELLNASGMRSALERLVGEQRIPVLGVCVGMQILASGSDEGKLPGLGWVPGQVRALASFADWGGLPVPHMGWNDVRGRDVHGLFKNLEVECRFYFLHSYVLECVEPTHVAATTTYGVEFCCAVKHDNVYGVQFHPEKSHESGMRLLQNFAEL
jgi:glutamine amidotransferase